ncbi:MAG: hypothetical protein ISP90_15090 [Nevskia sp.]|nr:hypothetical protein [Nevskia sp.]
MNMQTPSDEILMAYADGALSGAEAAEVRDAAARDPAVAARIEMFRASGRLLRGAFEPVLHQPVPQNLQDAVAALGAPVPGRQGRHLLAGPRHRPRSRMWAQALAASVALVLALAAGWRLGPGRGEPAVPGTLMAAAAALPAPLTAALDRLPSGEVAQVRVGLHTVGVLPLASYDAHGSVCREFELTAAAGAGDRSLRGVVCRGGGRWLLRALAEPAAPAAAEAGDGYLPASGGGELAPLLGLAQPLSPAEERQRLAKGWR